MSRATSTRQRSCRHGPRPRRCRCHRQPTTRCLLSWSRPPLRRRSLRLSLIRRQAGPIRLWHFHSQMRQPLRSTCRARRLRRRSCRRKFFRPRAVRPQERVPSNRGLRSNRWGVSGLRNGSCPKQWFLSESRSELWRLWPRLRPCSRRRPCPYRALACREPPTTLPFLACARPCAARFHRSRS
jgi:hypothetical protein